ncbi:MAG: carboxypeptidase regulatory-like domain-containing protein [Planctomycetes bacterium]|nr:carboxypeptidase regulatory-like domain-containing protein [Planctomycetota bacterium]
MATNARRNLLLALVACLGLVLAGGAFWLLSTPPDAGAARPLANPDARAGAPLETESGERREATPLVDESDLLATPEASTTVVYPLRVELELVRATSELQAEGAPRRGSSATARIKGSIMDSNGQPVRGQVEVRAGPNAGRVFYCDGKGQFGANDLYPGRVLLDVTGPGILGSLREVVLRQERETLLHIGYGRPASVIGEVYDAEGNLLEGAKVTLDGLVAQTDEQGTFSFPYVAAGETTLFVEKEGFASTFQVVPVPAGGAIEKGRLKFRLQRGARLVISLNDRVNSGVPAQVFVLPSSLSAQRSYPWFKLNPVQIYPGGTVTVDDLPPQRVTLRLYHAGAIAKPAQREVTLDPGAPQTVELAMEPAPVVVGIVKLGDRPAANAEVSLEVPDRVAATLTGLGESNFLLLESEVLPDSPLAVQRVTTNASGEFQLSANESVSKVRYLVARSADGKAQGGVVLRGGEEKVEIVMQPISASDGAAEFVLQTSPRFQGLPVEVTVDGTPRDRVVLPPERDLHVEGLVAGEWRVRVTWQGGNVMEPQLVDLRAEVTLSVKLPEGAVIGQDDETRRRAGK